MRNDYVCVTAIRPHPLVHEHKSLRMPVGTHTSRYAYQPVRIPAVPTQRRGAIRPKPLLHAQLAPRRLRGPSGPRTDGAHSCSILAASRPLRRRHASRRRARGSARRADAPTNSPAWRCCESTPRRRHLCAASSLPGALPVCRPRRSIVERLLLVGQYRGRSRTREPVSIVIIVFYK
jgi:hypothetical protein